MPTSKVERVRGANDVLPETCEALQGIQGRLNACFASFGYRPIDVPVIEHTELYLKKSGEELISRLYDFTFQNRRLCLRPEMTASVVRAYVEGLQDASLPVRLCYAGSVFRYEKPQRGRYRQFTQVGLEIVGASGAMADAEILSMACKGLSVLRLRKYRMSIGHVGILTEFLQRLDLESRLAVFLLTNAEAIRTEDAAEVARRIGKIYPSFLSQSEMTGSGNLSSAAQRTAGGLVEPERLATFLGGLDEVEARGVILDLLEGMTIKLDTPRDPGEIADRLLTKMKRRDQSPQLRRALEFMGQLGQLIGEPTAVLAEARRLLAAYGIGLAPLEQLAATIDLLSSYDLAWDRISLDLGMSRGLQYYTGMVFEIQHGALDEERQLCGGGRYDDLVTLFGGRQPTPAAGFAFGIERIHQAMESEGITPGARRPHSDVLVVPVTLEDRPYAIRVAERLRLDGLQVELDVRGRSVTGNLQRADKQHIPFVAVAGAEEAAASMAVLKSMATRATERLAIDEIAARIREVGKES